MKVLQKPTRGSLCNLGVLGVASSSLPVFLTKFFWQLERTDHAERSH
jgi:hypothetical protein